jgi:hypothetical protein
MDLLTKTIEEINPYTSNWTWWKPGQNVFLGSCYSYRHFLGGSYVLKEGMKSKDVLKCWKTENLITECKSANFILGTLLVFNKFGEEYCDNNLEMFDYIHVLQFNPFWLTIPMNEKGEYSEDYSKNSRVFGSFQRSLDYHRIPGCVAYLEREIRFQKLDSSFQGENLIVADPDKKTYVGFFRDVSKSLDKAKFIIKTKKEILEQLYNNGKNDLLKNYPNSIFEMENLLKFQKEVSSVRSLLNFESDFVKIGNKFYNKSEKINKPCPCKSNKKFKNCCAK